MTPPPLRHHCLTLALLSAWGVLGFGSPTPVFAQMTEEEAAVEAEAGTAQDGEDTDQAADFPDTPQEIVISLGWWFGIPFALASVITVWFAFERLVVLRRGRVIPRPFVERFLQHLKRGKLDPPNALALCEQSASPVASIFAHGIRKWGKPSVEVEQAIIDGGERQVNLLRKHLRVLNGVATVTPLIGLLGTVIGMIEAFRQISDTAAGNIGAELASGIALALYSTAFGLLIAIPALILYLGLAGKVDSLVMEMDELAQNVVNLISAEAIASQQAMAKPRTRMKKPNPADVEAG